MISGFGASDTVTAAFYKDGELYKQVQNPAGDKYWRFYAPQGADTLYISTNGTAEKLELNTAGNGTQIPDGSFEIMAKTGTSAWPGQVEPVETVSVPGGDFETEISYVPQGWQASRDNGSIIIETELPGDRAGKALKLTGNTVGAGIGVRSSGYSISEGVRYSVALDYFIESDVKSADLYIEFWPDVPENGNRISWDGMINACVVKNAWTHFEKTVTAPQGAKYITLILYMNRNDGADGSDVAYLDNVVVRPSNPLPLAEGTFETIANDPAPWSASYYGTSVTYTDQKAKTGTKSLKVTANVNENKIINAEGQTVFADTGVRSPKLPATAGKTYSLSAAYISSHEANAHLEFYANDGTTLLGESKVAQADCSDWESVSVSGTAPANTAYVAALFDFPGASDAAMRTMYIDDVAVKEDGASVNLPNGGFEDYYSWQATNYGTEIVFSADKARTGGKSLKYSVPAKTGGAAHTQLIPVTAGESYTFEAYYQASNAFTSVYMNFWSENDFDRKETKLLATNYQTLAAASDWQKVQIAATAPEGATYASVSLVTASKKVAAVYLDDVSFTKDGPADAIINDDFETLVITDHGFQGWSANGMNMVKTADEKYSGNTSAHITASSGSVGVRSPLMPINQGETYTGYFNYKTQNTNLNIYLEYWKSTDTSNASNRVLEKHHALTPTTENWGQAVSETLSAPSGAKYVAISIYFTYSSSASEAWVDNAYLVRSEARGNYDTLVSDEFVTDGSSGLKLVGTNMTSPRIPVLSAKEYVVRADVKGAATMKMVYYNVEDKIMGTYTASSSGTAPQTLEIRKNAPNHSLYAYVSLETTGTAYFDNLQMFTVTDGISNASFEDVTHLAGGKIATNWQTFGDVAAQTTGGINMPDRALAMKLTGSGGIRSSMMKITPGKEYLLDCAAVSGTVKKQLAFYDDDFNRLSVGAIAPQNAAYACAEFIVEDTTAVIDAVKFTPSVIDVADKVQLFIDDYVIESSTLTRTFHQGKKTDPLEAMKPVKDGSMPWQTNGAYLYGSVLYDEKEELFKMWYSSYNPIGSDRVAVLSNYATSKDGVSWELPNLGIGFGSYGTDNNITGNYHNQSVFLEYDDAGNPQYTMITYLGGTGYQYMHSTDGIHWTQGDTAIGGSGTYDVVSAAPDKTNDRYISVAKIYGLGDSHRTQYTLYGKGNKWSGRYMSNSIADLIDAQTCYRPESYGMGLYERDGVYIGFDWLYRTPGPGGNRNWSVGTIEPQLAFSRDLTEEWQRPTTQALVPLGADGEIDDGIIDTANYAIEVGNEVWLYCGVWDGNHGISNRDCNTYIAKWRLDGFVSMNGSGILTTKQLDFEGDALYINSKGNVTVELLDANGNSILGESDVISADSVKNLVTWNGVSDLSSINQPVKVKINAVNAEIYSFEFGKGPGVRFEWNGNDCTVTLDSLEEGVTIKAAVYTEERLVETVTFDSEKMSAVLSGDTVKVFFWKENLMPVRNAVESKKPE